MDAADAVAHAEVVRLLFANAPVPRRILIKVPHLRLPSLPWNTLAMPLLDRNNTTLRSVVLPLGMPHIPLSCFQTCRALTAVHIPGSVVIIRQYAFSQCVSLTAVTMDPGVIQISHMAFHGCVNLVSVAFPQTVAKIATFAFDGCGALDLATRDGICARMWSN